MKKVICLAIAISLWLIGARLCLGEPSVEKVIARSEPKVVKIGIVMDKGGGVCSGAIISKSGIVLTCAHCFEHGTVKKVFIKTSDGRIMLAQPLMIDGKKDLALIAPLHYSGAFSYFHFGHKPVVGQQVISMGSPLGIAHTATVGWVSNLSRIAYVYHSAFINPGNSGGPLLDLHGNIIGVNEATISYGFLGLHDAGGLYIAISLDTIHKFLGGK